MKLRKGSLSLVSKQVPGKVILLSLVVLLATIAVQAQNEANNWIFGNQAGLNFSSGSPSSFSFTSTPSFNTQEGSSSISDQSGQLLFYTDGRTVWNRNHAQMPNGFGLLGGSSATQSALIVPRPGSDCGQYFIFTVDEMGPQKQQKLHYSVVDMTLLGGLGNVTTKNTFLKADVSEKLAAVRDAAGTGFQVVVHGFKQPGPSNPNPSVNSEFYAYHVTAATTGTNLFGTEFPSTAGTAHQNSAGTEHPSSGQMKISSNGAWIACAVNAAFVEILNFNSSTGAVSGTPRTYNASASSLPFNSISVYGLEFSPNSQFLYVTTTFATPSKLFQLDLSISTSTWTPLATGTATRDMAQLQLGPDGRIYVARENIPNIGVINSPSTAGASYNPNGVTLVSGQSKLGLPTMIGGTFSCAPTPTPTPTPDCCDRLAAVPHPQPEQSIDYRTFTITNLKAPVSPICFVDINFNPSVAHQGGQLSIDGMPLPLTPFRFVSPYNRVPNNPPLSTISAVNTVQFNLGVDYTLNPPWVGTVTFVVHHCDGTTCTLTYGPWSALPPSSPPGPNVFDSTLRVEGNLHVLSFQLKRREMRTPINWISFTVADGKGQIFAAAQSTASEEGARAAPIAMQEDTIPSKGSVLYKFVRSLRSGEASGTFDLVIKRDATSPPVIVWKTYDSGGNAIETGTITSRRTAP
jgi:hypothetical protein